MIEHPLSETTVPPSACTNLCLLHTHTRTQALEEEEEKAQEVTAVVSTLTTKQAAATSKRTNASDASSLDNFVVFVNGRSGGGVGGRIIQLLQSHGLPKENLCDLANGGPRAKLLEFKHCSPPKLVLCCGGDGTACWVMVRPVCLCVCRAVAAVRAVIVSLHRCAGRHGRGVRRR